MNLLKSLHVVGDRILIEPNASETQTNSGLYLPATVKEKEEIRTGRILKVGPGTPIPHLETDHVFQEQSEQVKYVPLQAHEGDEVLYLRKLSHEIEYEGQKLVIAPQSAILLIIRDALRELDI